MGRRRKPALSPVDRDWLERVARIIGPSSAAAACLRDADEFLAGGLERKVSFYRDDASGMWICEKHT